MKEKPKFKTIPLWKWILLYFRPAHMGFDTKGDVACVHYAKMLFKTVYIMREDYFCISTGNLLNTRKLTRKDSKTEKIDKVVRGKLWVK